MRQVLFSLLAGLAGAAAMLALQAWAGPLVRGPQQEPPPAVEEDPCAAAPAGTTCYVYSDRLTPADVAASLGVAASDVTVTTYPDGRVAVLVKGSVPDTQDAAVDEVLQQVGKGTREKKDVK